MASPTIQFKRGLFVNLPELRAGEPGLTTDKHDFYVGGVGGNKFFGSHRYWEKETGTNALKLKLVDKDGNNSIGLRAPATLANSNTNYTLPAAPTDGYFLKTNATGELEWASVTAGASFDNVTVNNSTFTGVSTFSGAIDANAGLNVAGGSTFDNIDVTGVGTITTADINGGNIDGTVIGSGTAAAGTFTHLAYNSSSTSGISTVGSLYAGADKVLSVEGGNLTLSNIDAIDAVTKATLEASLALDPNDFATLNVSGISTIGGLLDANAGADIFGQTDLDTLAVSGVSTFTGAINANGGVIGNVTGDVSGNAGTATSLATARTIGLGGDLSGSASFDGTSNITITASVQPNSVDLGTDTTGNYVATVTGTANQISVSGSGSETAAVTLSLPSDVVVGTSLSAPTVKTATVQHSNGTEAITIDSSGNVGVSTNLTVSGNLVVNGTTTQVNTTSLTVEDTLVELGMVDGAAPGSDVNKDLGLLFNYYSGSAKKAAVYWDDSANRIVFADDVTESASVLTATTYATVLAGGLEINNACTGGTDTVISCVNSELALSNIVLDGGSF